MNAEQPPTRILLVRHGTTPTTGRVLPGRAPGLHLADRGRDEAEVVAERLAPLRLDAIYASPLERTVETAEPTSHRTGLGVRREAGLLECEFGEWTGRELGDLAKLPEWATVQRTPSVFRFPGGESFAELRDRMRETIERIRMANEGGTVACFSHADPIRVYVSHALGMPLDAMQRISIATCSVTALSFGRDGSTSVLTVNSTSAPLGELLVT
ncbi:histidine phosphatase family protein [Pseudoclavibacter endophyticus]|uniref:Phosphoglycerate mutase n=1 Tax=Pseudoclavibacter endophyticus TaxID=1778590 RepID=A0A6H9WPD6_9MICO|nr:histidine phosphatase family protein [Pseudoclavibacter endophyticus]KAB1649968.1 phosphoglycerate mutase [Pseudoclavibacter endophyticus]